MEISQPQYFSVEEICCATELPSQTIIEIIDHGIIQPKGASPDDWSFNIRMITVTKKACRLHNDLDIDWAGIALAISLLDELEQLRQENRELHRRLQRFMDGE
jgi:chaperone modulatory protein CbpM